MSDTPKSKKEDIRKAETTGWLMIVAGCLNTGGAMLSKQNIFYLSGILFFLSAITFFLKAKQLDKDETP